MEGERKRRKGEKQKNYKELNMEQLEEWFDSKTDAKTIWTVFKGNEFDLNKTIEDLSNLTGIVPKEMKETEKMSEGIVSVVKEVKGDLFSCDPTESLAHCISRDIKMGKGIAVLFRNKFGQIEKLKNQNRAIGEAAILSRGPSSFVYNMITKEKYWNKPTYETLRQSLEYVRDHAQKEGVRNLSMPRIGCGLDGLLWPKVKQILQDVFGPSGITVTVYSL